MTCARRHRSVAMQHAPAAGRRTRSHAHHTRPRRTRRRPVDALALRPADPADRARRGGPANIRFGPLALAVGLALSFVAIGLFIATVGFSLGLTGDVFRIAAALLMVLIGVVLLVPQAPRCASPQPVGPQASGSKTASRLFLDRSPGPIRRGAAARRGLEPLRRTDARRRLGAGGEWARIWVRSG